MSILEDIVRGEPYDLEFKLIPNEERIKYLKTVVAFANGRGRRLLFGVASSWMNRLSRPSWTRTMICHRFGQKQVAIAKETGEQ